MNDISAVALFCEDIREEKIGTETIVGVFPDNVNIQKVPGIFPKICIYVRLHFRPDVEPGRILTRIIMPDDTEANRNEIQPQLIKQAREQAMADGSPYAGLITKFIISPMQVTSIGRIRAMVTVNGKECIAGALNLRLSPSSAN